MKLSSTLLTEAMAPASSGQPCCCLLLPPSVTVSFAIAPLIRITTARRLEAPRYFWPDWTAIRRRPLGGAAAPADLRYRARVLHPPPSDPGRVLLWYSNTVATVDRSSEEPAGPPANALSTRAPTPGSRTARQVPRQPLGWWLPAPPRRPPPRRPTGSSRTIPARSCTIIIIPSN